MKNRIITRLSLIIALLITLLSFQAIQAQEITKTKFEITEAEFQMNAGKPYLTERLKERIDVIFEGIRNPANHEYIVIGKTDSLMWNAIKQDSRYGLLEVYGDDEVSFQEKNDLLENDLELRRAMVVASHLIKTYSIPPENIDSRPAGADDSNSRSVDIVLIDRSSINIPLAQINTDIDNLQRDLANNIQRDNEQDEQLKDHRGDINDNAADNKRQDREIDELSQRVSVLESRNINVSGHIGLNGEYFADQIAPTLSAGVKIGQLELAGWFGYMSNISTADLDIGTVDLNRQTYGGMATWYAIEAGPLSLGPSIGWEHGEDVIEGRGSYLKVYESAMVGASVDVEIVGPLHLRANIAYTPIIKSYAYNNQVLQDVNQPIRGNLGISINF